MIFFARMKSNTPVDRLWRQRRQQEGLFRDVLFRRTVSAWGDFFESDKLDDTQVASLRTSKMVDLISIGRMPPTPGSAQ